MQLNSLEMKEVLGGKQVYIYGAGGDGIRFYRNFFYGCGCEIKGFIDGNPELWGKSQFSLPIFPPEKASALGEDAWIVIASMRYWKEMEQQLRRIGVPADRYAVWLEPLVSVYGADRFIAHCKTYWGKAPEQSCDNQVLVSYTFVPPLDLLTRSYLSNLLAEKYQAELWGIPWEFTDTDQENGMHWQMYRAFHVKGIVEERLTESQSQRATEEFLRIKASSQTRHDYRNIVCFGIDFGEEIMGDYSRNIFPAIDIADPAFERHLNRMLRHIVFWHDYFIEHTKIKAIVFQDGIFREGIIRKLAALRGIPCYGAHYTGALRMGFHRPNSFPYYKMFFESLSAEDQALGLALGKKHLQNRLSGDNSDRYGYKSVFENTEKARILKDSDKLKVMIFHHFFEEDGFPYGEMLFDDQWEWLCTLGELSKQTDFDWYLKIHIAAKCFCRGVLQRFSQLYPHITIVEADVSPHQLKREGLDVALTIYGTLGHEYPALGIQVVNAGNHPHVAFDFTWTPKSVEEYCDWILHLDRLHKRIDMDELYMFYCIHYHWYEVTDKIITEKIYGEGITSARIWENFEEALDAFLSSFTPEWHEYLRNLFSALLEEMDFRRDEIFIPTEEFRNRKQNLPLPPAGKDGTDASKA